MKTLYAFSRRLTMVGVCIIMMMLSGCTFLNNGVYGITNTSAATKAATAASLLPESETTPVPACQSRIISLNKLVNAEEIDAYHLPKNGQYIYAHTKDNWWKFSVDDLAMSPMYNLAEITSPTPSAVQQYHQRLLEDLYPSLEYKSSLSPNGTYLVYWDIPKRIILPTSTPNPDGLAEEDYSEIGEMEIYILTVPNPEPIHLGTIPGHVKKAYWFADGKRVLLEMFSFSPYNLWLVDAQAATLVPLLSEVDVSSAPKFAVLDISSDGNWIIYQHSLSEYVSMINVNDLSVDVLYGGLPLKSRLQFLATNDTNFHE